MSEQEKWGAAVKSRMDLVKVSTSELGRRMGVDRRATTYWLRGRNGCKAIHRLADILFPDAPAGDTEKLAFIREHDNAFASRKSLPPWPPPPPPPPPPPVDHGSYRLGRITTSMFVLDHARKGYSYNEFRTVLVPWEEPPLPVSWREGMELALAEAGRLQAEGKINDNPILALREVKWRREGSGEPSGFDLTFSEMGYVRKRAATIFFHDHLGEDERAALLDDLRDWRLHPGLSRCLNTQVAVITSDGKFMLARRSRGIINPGKFTCGVAETMEESDGIASDGKGGPDVFRAALRGLRQEFGIDVEAFPGVDPHRHVKILSLLFDMDFYEPIFSGIADFRGAPEELRRMTTARAIEDGLRSGRAKDRWENKQVIFVDFTLRSLLRFAGQHDLTNYATVCLVQALQYDNKSDRDITSEWDALFPLDTAG